MAKNVEKRRNSLRRHEELPKNKTPTKATTDESPSRRNLSQRHSAIEKVMLRYIQHVTDKMCWTETTTRGSRVCSFVCSEFDEEMEFIEDECTWNSKSQKRIDPKIPPRNNHNARSCRTCHKSQWTTTSKILNNESKIILAIQSVCQQSAECDELHASCDRLSNM